MYRTIYGTHDILPEDQPHWARIHGAFEELARLYGFARIDTPIFEAAAVFRKGVGEGTDIVDKEMYVFRDKGGGEITLRPEFTASVVRAYIQHGMPMRSKPVKLYSVGPLFRHDRPAAGRYRQFHQLNAETIGTADPAADAEILALARDLARRLGFRQVRFHVNSTGCPACKPPYVAELVAYLEPRRDRLPPTDRDRLQRNPLRILDSKEEGIEEVLRDAPRIGDTLCASCRDHFAELLDYLEALEIAWVPDWRLVRGLDYYTKTVFETFVEGLPAGAAICGGGRYDGLVEILGGPPTPAVGFAAGIERIILALKDRGEGPAASAPPAALFVHFGGATKREAVRLSRALRDAGIAACIALGDRGLRAQLRLAGKLGAPFAVICGEDELASGTVTLRDMRAGDQVRVPAEELAARIREGLEGGGTP